MSVVRKMYHTQGMSAPYLTEPLKCTRSDAWLGDGYYFWYDESDAILWGQHAKKPYKRFVVYSAEINCDDVLDTVFNEEHYVFWLRSIDKIAETIIKNTGEKPNIKELNLYLKERGGWKNVTGIMFQDLPTNEILLKVIKFYYRKRIQLVAFENTIIHNFAHNFEGAC
jgi:hypothetical protein